MDQNSAPLAGLASGNSFSIGGLLSQLGNALNGGAVQDSAFSNLLSQSDVLQTVVAQTQIAPVTAAPAQNVSPTSSVDDASSTQQTQTQALTGISAHLHKAIKELRAQDTNTSAAGGTNAKQTVPVKDAQTAQNTAQPKGTVGKKNDQPTDALAGNKFGNGKKDTQGDKPDTTTQAVQDASDQTSTTAAADTAATTDAPQSPADVVAELLALMQMLVQSLHQLLQSGNAPSSQSASATTAANGGKTASNGNMADQDGTGASDPLQKLMETLAADIKQLMSIVPNAAQGGTQAAASIPAVPTQGSETASSDPLQNLLATLTDDIKKLVAIAIQAALEQTGQKDKNQSSDTATTQANPATSGNAAATDPLQDLFAALQGDVDQLASLVQNSPQDNTSSSQSAASTQEGTTVSATLQTVLAAVQADVKQLVSLTQTIVKDNADHVAAVSQNTVSTAATNDATSAAPTPSAGSGFSFTPFSLRNQNSSAPAVKLTPPADMPDADSPEEQTASRTSASASKNFAGIVNPNDGWKAQLSNFWTGAPTQTNQPTAPATSAQIFTASAGFTAGDNGAADTGGNNAGMMSGDNASSSNNFGLRAGVAPDSAQITGSANFANQLDNLRFTTSSSLVNQPSVADQVILQMSRNIKNGNDQMSLQLHPADLGKITIKLDVSDQGKVQGVVTADNPKTLEMLQKDSRSLERALQDAGLRADPGSLQFNLGGQSGQNAGHSAGSEQASSGTATGTISASDEDEGGDATSPAEIYYVSATGVNIRV